ncbi:hypothetical protein MLD38_013825 [Melastoma candidum]|uniref:Uncharacterized protein n=1 Tax=Melastoma candidum TaxID=119954 RepID=A0ACB9RBF1_9MYRT|nr:hypothetical protein MLD38_013825 [Melastoma candidum]
MFIGPHWATLWSDVSLTSPFSHTWTVTNKRIISDVATNPSISFHHLPAVSLPHDFKTTSPHHETLAFELIRFNNPNILHSLLTLSEEYSVKAFIMDLFCGVAPPVVRDLGIPCYFFFVSEVGMHCFFFYLPCLH